MRDRRFYELRFVLGEKTPGRALMNFRIPKASPTDVSPPIFFSSNVIGKSSSEDFKYQDRVPKDLK